MSKLLLPFVTLIVTMLPALTIAGEVHPGRPNCQSLLDNHVYRCHVKSSFGSEFDDCFRFTSPGVQSIHFDFSVDELPGQVLGCTCQPTGTFTEPDFNKSKDFSCVTSGSGIDEDLGITFQGKVVAAGLGIVKGQAVNEFGDSFVFLCHLEPSCSVPGFSIEGNGGNPYRQE